MRYIIILFLILLCIYNTAQAEDIQSIQRIELDFDNKKNITNIRVYDNNNQNYKKIKNTLSNNLKTYLADICEINKIENKTLRIMVCTDTTYCNECDTLNYNNFIWEYGYSYWLDSGISKKVKTQDFIDNAILLIQGWIVEYRKNWGF